MDDNLDVARKRVLFRSHHTGMKENDILIGAFASRYVPTMSGEDLAWFERLLMDHDDIDLHNWIIGQKPVPDELDHPIMRLLTNFRLHP